MSSEIGEMFDSRCVFCTFSISSLPDDSGGDGNGDDEIEEKGDEEDEVTPDKSGMLERLSLEGCSAMYVDSIPSAAFQHILSGSLS